MVAFLSDLFYVLEVRPVKCVQPPALLHDRYSFTDGNNFNPINFNSIIPTKSSAAHRQLLLLLLLLLLLHSVARLNYDEFISIELISFKWWWWWWLCLGIV